MMFSQETHKMPLPPRAMGESDWEKICQRTQDFIDESSPNHPILFVDPGVKDRDLNAARKAIKLMFNETGLLDEASYPRVCGLKELFYRMQQKASKITNKEAFASKQKAQQVIDSSTFIYSTCLDTSGCQYHVDEDVPLYCCLARLETFLIILQ